MTARTETGFGVKRDFQVVPLLQGGRVSEKSLGVNTLQTTEPLTKSIPVPSNNSRYT